MLATFLGSPSIDAGNTYLLPSIAAVVVGGTALTGGKGSIIASALGALFLTQLNAVVSGMGATTSVQLIVEGAVILFALTLRGLLRVARLRLPRRPTPVAAASRMADPDPRDDQAEPMAVGQPSTSDNGHTL
jgi:ribose transport system permease protein